MKGSSTNAPNIPSSSSLPPSDFQAWQRTMEEANKPRTPAAIKAAGDVKVKIGVLWMIGVTCTVLSAFGGVMFFYNPSVAKDVWVITGPIITAALTGTLGYLSGEKNASK